MTIGTLVSANGPAGTSVELDAFVAPPISHRSAEFVEQLSGLRARLARLARASDVQVLLGSATGTDPVVLKSELNSQLSTLKTWLNGHTHPVPAGPGTSSAASTPIGTLSVSGSSNTEAKS